MRKTVVTFSVHIHRADGVTGDGCDLVCITRTKSTLGYVISRRVSPHIALRVTGLFERKGPVTLLLNIYIEIQHIVLICCR